MMKSSTLAPFFIQRRQHDLSKRWSDSPSRLEFVHWRQIQVLQLEICLDRLYEVELRQIDPGGDKLSGF
jgi:hypothetical protein